MLHFVIKVSFMLKLEMIILLIGLAFVKKLYFFPPLISQVNDQPQAVINI